MTALTLGCQGARIGLDAPVDIAERVATHVADVAARIDRGGEDATVSVVRRRDGRWDVTSETDDVVVATDSVERAVVDQVHRLFALHARGVIFFHAGAVGLDGRVVLVPGRSFSGKTTLVESAVRAGWEYYSDEFAVIDATGSVHPYPRPLGVREVDSTTSSVPVTELGGRIASSLGTVAAVVSTHYRPASTWSPVIVEGSAAALPLIDNAVRARLAPQAVVATAAAVIDGGARTYIGDRGEAAEVVAALAELLEVSIP